MIWCIIIQHDILWYGTACWNGVFYIGILAIIPPTITSNNPWLKTHKTLNFTPSIMYGIIDTYSGTITWYIIETYTYIHNYVYLSLYIYTYIHVCIYIYIYTIAETIIYNRENNYIHNYRNIYIHILLARYCSRYKQWYIIVYVVVILSEVLLFFLFIYY